MGYNTTLMVLNDRWHEVFNNPLLFVESVEEEMRKGGGEAAFQTTVMPMCHADDVQLYFAQGNLMTHFWMPETVPMRLLPEMHERVEKATNMLWQYDTRLMRRLG